MGTDIGRKKSTGKAKCGDEVRVDEMMGWQEYPSRGPV